MLLELSIGLLESSIMLLELSITLLRLSIKLPENIYSTGSHTIVSYNHQNIFIIQATCLII